jgi:hypothetical protein
MAEATCRYGHVFNHRTSPGYSVRCPRILRPGDRRPEVKGQPKPDGARCDHNTYIRMAEVDSGPPVSPEMAARLTAWAAVAPYAPSAEFPPLRPQPGADGDGCPDCGAELAADPFRTVLVCGGHPQPRLYDYPGVIAARAGREQAPGQLAADPVEAEDMRVNLRTRKDSARAWIEVRAERLDPGWFSQEACSLDTSCPCPDGHPMTAYLMQRTLINHAPEIDAAPTTAEVDRIMAKLTAIERTPVVSHLGVVQEQAALAADRELRRLERSQHDTVADRGRPAVRAEQNTPAAIGPPPVQPDPAPQHQTIWGLGAVIAGQLLTQHEARKTRIERNGACQFRHRVPAPATRFYQGGSRDRSGAYHQDPGAESVRACDQHHASAEAHLTARGLVPVWTSSDQAGSGVLREAG